MSAPELPGAHDAARAAAAAEEAAREAAIACAGAVRRLRAERAAAVRRIDPRDPEGAERLAAADAAIAEAEEALSAARASAAKARVDAAAARRVFGELADPRKETSRLDDGVPVLLMPVRLETRFAPGELWVRVFPDEWAVDAFSARLSEQEAASAARYWAAVWEAGGDEEGRRAAWRGLVASHGSGRAGWIVEHLTPANPPDEPARASAEEQILVVAGSELPAAADRPVASAYWEAVWRGAETAAGLAAAEAQLDASGLPAEAAAAVRSAPPFNLDVDPVPGTTRATAPLTVAFCELPAPADLDLAATSWSVPPRARVLPDRWVLLGYDGEGLALQELGAPIPSDLAVGPDPMAAPDDALHVGDDGALVVPDELLWMTDFDRAVQDGMGFRVALGDRTRGGFERLLVLGLRVAETPDAARQELERLLRRHHESSTGFGLVPQGTPTNNTEALESGYDRLDDPDASFDHRFGGAALAEEGDWARRTDGQWLATALGIRLDALVGIPGALGTDQLESRAANRALWPATWGYLLETMLSPLLGEAPIERARVFFERYVSGRGLVPAVRVGRQPYGILPTTAFSRLSWPREDGQHTPGFGGVPFEARLDALLRHVAADWAPLAGAVPHVGSKGDPHQTLLDIVGAHPASVEFHQRYAESLDDLFNRAYLGGEPGAMYEAWEHLRHLSELHEILTRLGWDGRETPEIWDKVWLAAQQELSGPVVDDRPASEADPVRAWTSDGRNYLRWLADAGRGSLDDLRAQNGFANGGPPTALLYLLLRHAMILSWWDTALRLRVDAGSIGDDIVAAQRREPAFVHVAAGPEAASESRWAVLQMADANVTGDPSRPLADFIPTIIGPGLAGARVHELVEAIEALADVPTARLERLLAEHVDVCAYRLDAWRLGLVHERLLAFRGDSDGAAPPPGGIHLGAFGWLEDVRPQERRLSPAEVPEGLSPAFENGDGRQPLMADAANGGYVHAPSLNHAGTAAVLRSGYLAGVERGDPGALAVDLTSERVRLALGVLEGIRNGQSLGALLGYRFERGLHDRHGLAEVDQFVYALRKRFPLRADRLGDTATEPDVPIEAIEARNVLDGLELVRHVTSTGDTAYPFGLTGLPAANGPQTTAIGAEVQRLLDVHDAIADLALAEGVHQAVLGNHERVASTLDAYGRGGFPPEPAVVETPRTGVTLTHRVALHLRTGLSHTASPVAGVPMTPRAIAEPAVNELLAAMLPLPADVACAVSWTDPVSSAPRSTTVTQEDLGLQPVDLMHLLMLDDESTVGELDELIVRHVRTAESLRPDARPLVTYTERVPGKVSLFELSPLAAHLRTLVGRARPLRPTDVQPPTTADAVADTTLQPMRARPAAVLVELQTLAVDTGTLRTDLEAADTAARLAGVDTFAERFAGIMARAGLHGLTGTGWAGAFEERAAIFAAVLEAVGDVVPRLDVALAQADELLAYEAALPLSATDEERFAPLALAERFLATTILDPRPATPSDYRTAIVAQRTAFVGRRDDLVAAGPAATTLGGLFAAVSALDLTPFDATGLDLTTLEDRAVAICQALLDRAVALGEELATRDAAAAAELARHDAAPTADERVDAIVRASRLLCGEDLVVAPEFSLAEDAGGEWEAALAWSRGGQLTGHLPSPFAVEDWLHGVARVRPKIRALEQATLLAGVVGRAEPVLQPIQLPHAADGWLGLDFAPGQDLAGDRVLYTAHYPGPFDKAAPQSGLLVDEWTEVVPGVTETTGLAFHYDRPDSEPPQAMLLVVPPERRGEWRWDDLVAALHETLDLARQRAVEPAAIDGTAYAQLLPATVMAATVRQVSISTNLAVNNGLIQYLAED